MVLGSLTKTKEKHILFLFISIFHKNSQTAVRTTPVIILNTNRRFREKSVCEFFQTVSSFIHFSHIIFHVRHVHFYIWVILKGINNWFFCLAIFTSATERKLSGWPYRKKTQLLIIYIYKARCNSVHPSHRRVAPDAPVISCH